MVRWLGLHAFTVKGPGSILSQGTKILQATQPKKKEETKLYFSNHTNSQRLNTASFTLTPRLMQVRGGSAQHSHLGTQADVGSIVTYVSMITVVGMTRQTQGSLSTLPSRNIEDTASTKIS